MYLCGRKQHSSKLPSQLYKSRGRKGLTDFSRANRAREQERNERMRGERADGNADDGYFRVASIAVRCQGNGFHNS